MRRLSLLLVSAVMALTLIAVAAGVSAAAPQQQAPHNYLVTYSDDTGVAYPGYSSTGLGAASIAAQRKCEAEGTGKCYGDVWVQNGYIAYVLNGDETQLFWTFGHTRSQATSQALNNCGDVATGCAVSQTFKSHPYDKALPTKGGYDVP